MDVSGTTSGSGYSSQIANTEYLELLTIQLQNQDPLDPVSQEDFTAQLAQFSMLEGIEGLNTSFESMLQLQEISQGLNLVGKSVDYLNTVSGEIESGTVKEFFVEDGLIYLKVNDQTISVDLIAGVKAGS